MIEVYIPILIGAAIGTSLVIMGLWIQNGELRKERDSWMQAWRRMNDQRIEEETHSNKLIKHYRDRLFKLYNTMKTALEEDDKAGDTL